MPHAISSSHAEKYRQPCSWEFQKVLDHNGEILNGGILFYEYYRLFVSETRLLGLGVFAGLGPLYLESD